MIEVGDKVTYKNHLSVEHGVVKRLCDDPQFVFVVYHCDNDWNNYQNYTAARTSISDLEMGWT